MTILNSLSRWSPTSSLFHILFLQMCANRDALKADNFQWIWSSRSKLDIVEATMHSYGELMQETEEIEQCAWRRSQSSLWIPSAKAAQPVPEVWLLAGPFPVIGMCLVHRNSKQAKKLWEVVQEGRSILRKYTPSRFLSCSVLSSLIVFLQFCCLGNKRKIIIFKYTLIH